MNFIDRGLIRFQLWADRAKEDFFSDERGISGIVAAIILLLIAIAIAAIFWDKISQLVNDWWTKINGDSDALKDKIKGP